VLAATHLINRLPTKVLQGKTPYEKLHASAPTYSHLRVFGCLCFMATHKQGRDKFQSRATAYVFLGYLIGQKGYKVMDLETHKVYVSRDITFHENVFPFAFPNKNQSLFQVQPSHCHDETTLGNNSSSIHAAQEEADGQVTEEPRRSCRTHNLPRYLQDYVCCTSYIQDQFSCFSTITNLCVPAAVAHTGQKQAQAQDQVIYEP